jgi:putative ABC transport system permease protein
MKEGRFLSAEDVGTTNAVISQPIADEFHVQVGDTMNVNGQDVTIVGVYETRSILLDVAIFMDAGVVRRITRFDPETVSDFYVEAKKGVDPEELATAIEKHFAGREAHPWRPPSLVGGEGGENPLKELFDTIDRAIKSAGGELPAEGASGGGNGTEAAPPAKEPQPPPPATDTADQLFGGAGSGTPKSAVEVRTASDWAAQVENLSADLDLILTILTSIGVLVALLSIVNTMLMSVTERIIDFGILKANGWSKTDVLKLITFESGLLGLSGGVLGATIGWVATIALNAAFPVRLHLYASPSLLAFAVGFSTVLGVAAGLYPAFWAMRMMPMDAIRRG